MASSAQNRRGILAMLVSVVAFVTSDALMKLASANLPTSEIIVLRGILATGLVAGVAAATGAFQTSPRALSPLILLRGVLEGFIAVLFITALTGLPLADITAILLASSLMATGLAAALGMEKVGIRRWSALVVGFIGVVIVLRPGLDGISPAAGLAVASTVLVAIRDIVTRRIAADTPTILIALATTILVTAAGMLLGQFGSAWDWPSGTAGLALVAAAFFMSIGNYMVIAAFRGADVAVVTPFRYASIVVATLMGFLIWRDTPDLWTLLGSAMIVGSGLYTIWRERVRAREAQARSGV